MKIIWRIVAMELAQLFYSVIAWLILVCYTLQIGFIFSRHLADFLVNQQEGFKVERLTYYIFFNPRYNDLGVISAAQQVFYLCIPILTMGLLSRELSSGSFKLLQSSPVTGLQIVLGKFIAMALFGSGMIFFIILTLITGAWSIPDLGVPEIISGLAGTYLSLCAFASIGIFMSGLTAYQLVAAISTLATIAALNYIGEVGQRIGFIRDLTYGLKMNGRLDQFMHGLLSTKNVIYFLSIIILFLGLTVFRLESKRYSGRRSVKIIAYAVFITAFLALNYIASLPGMSRYIDVTEGKTNTLSKNTQDVLNKVTKPLYIHTYVNILGRYYQFGTPENRNSDKDFFEPYFRFVPGLAIDYTYYYDSTLDGYAYKSRPGKTTKEIAIEQAPLRGFDFNKILSPEEIRRKFNPAKEEYQFVRELEADDQKTFLRVFNDNKVSPTETEINAALRKLIARPPKIAFLDNHSERSIDEAGLREYKMLANQPDRRLSLINQGFEVVSLSLDKEDIPEGLSALVIADPKTAFTENELMKIENYISDGGNMLIAAEPGSDKMLNPLLSSLGIQLSKEMLIRKNKDFPPFFLKAEFSAETESHFPDVLKLIDNKIRITMPGTLEIRIKGNANYKIDSFLIVKNTNTYFDKEGLYKDSAVKAFAGKLPEDSFSHEALTGALLTRMIKGREQRIVVLGDADLLSQAELNRQNVEFAYNESLNKQIFSWFTYGQFPVSIPAHSAKDNLISISEKKLGLIELFFLMMIPGVTLVTGTILLIRRKRK